MCLTLLLMAFKGVGGSPVQDVAPWKGYPACFTSDVGPDLVCGANFQKQ